MFPLSLSQLQSSLPEGGLFGGGSWRWSPEPFPLTKGEARQLMSIGHPLACFQRASDQLYRRSATGSAPEWIADWLDRGKPAWLKNWQRNPSTAGQFPRVIRPDLILTEQGFALTELDSVPGGIGVTAWLSETYARAGYEILGGSHGMLDGFRSILPDGGEVMISDEAADYRPEMEWLTSRLGEKWQVTSAEQGANSVASGHYRFFELFDWRSVPGVETLASASANGTCVTPPFKAHLEEKLWLAMFWTPSLRKFWSQHLRESHLRRLRDWVPYGWVVDPESLPPHAAIPKLNAHSWQEVAAYSQKQRRLVLKISGFHETAWGSRGVFIGHDLPTADWAQSLETALSQATHQPWMMQEFHEGRRVSHPVFRDDGTVEMMEARARLCPYFFTDDTGKTRFGGCLATLVPSDKKKIHGMKDGVLVPCVIGKSSDEIHSSQVV